MRQEQTGLDGKIIKSIKSAAGFPLSLVGIEFHSACAGCMRFVGNFAFLEQDRMKSGYIVHGQIKKYSNCNRSV